MTAATTNAISQAAGRAITLREEFDGSFAMPLRGDIARQIDLLAIRAGAERCAMRLSEIGGLFAGRSITPVPGAGHALLGIAGFRGAVVPVYSLTALLGHAGMPPPRWLVVAAGAPVALAFDAFEGHLRAPAEAILPQQAGMRGYAREYIRDTDAVRPVLHLPSVIAALVGAAQEFIA